MWLDYFDSWLINAISVKTIVTTNIIENLMNKNRFNKIKN